MIKAADCDKTFVRTTYYGVTFFTISVLSNKFSPLIPSAFGRLPYTDDRNYRPHLQLIYLWWSPDDRGPVCPIYCRPYLWITDQCKDPKQAGKFKVLFFRIVGVEVQSHTFIGFARVGMEHSVYWLGYRLILWISGVQLLEEKFHPQTHSSAHQIS